MEITVGMKGEVSTLVEKEDTADCVGSGSLLVYATPCMVALMEGAACEAIEEALREHLSPTRSNGLNAMLKQMRLFALTYQAQS